MPHFDKSLAGIYDAVGGAEAFQRISDRFHHLVEQDPVLRDLFPKDMTALAERLALYLSERAGGPPAYTEKRGKNSLLCRHAHLAIGTKEADRWLHHMREALAEAGIPTEISEKLLANLSELAHGLADPFIEVCDVPLAQLKEKLHANPALVTQNSEGRNLICQAAIRGEPERIALLLEFGADVHAEGVGGHTPIYRVANRGKDQEHQAVGCLEVLLTHGANPNQVSTGGMTPLHMAARRGTISIAELLLNHGAKIDAQDNKGETPLRRAINCGHEAMVEFLIEHRANPHLPDKKGITPESEIQRRKTVKRI